MTVYTLLVGNLTLGGQLWVKGVRQQFPTVDEKRPNKQRHSSDQDRFLLHIYQSSFSLGFLLLPGSDIPKTRSSPSGYPDGHRARVLHECPLVDGMDALLIVISFNVSSFPRGWQDFWVYEAGTFTGAQNCRKFPRGVRMHSQSSVYFVVVLPGDTKASSRSAH